MSYRTSPSKRGRNGGIGVLRTSYSPSTTAPVSSPTTFDPNNPTVKNETAWERAIPIIPAYPKQCIPDGGQFNLWNEYWDGQDGVIIKKDEDILIPQTLMWEQLYQYELDPVCDCIQGKYPHAYLNGPFTYSRNSAEINLKFSMHVAGYANTQKRIDYCWTKALWEGIYYKIRLGSNPPKEQKHKVAGAQNQINQKVRAKIPKTYRAKDFPNPCKFRGYDTDRVKGSHKVPGRNDLDQLPALPARCSQVMQSWNANNKRRHGGIQVAEKQVLSKGAEDSPSRVPLLHFSNSVRDRSVQYLDPSSPGSFLPGFPTAPQQPHLDIPRLRELMSNRAKDKEKRPISGVGSFYGEGVKIPANSAFYHNIMIAGTAVAVLGVSAFVYHATKRRR